MSATDHRAAFDAAFAAMPLIAILRGITTAEAPAIGEAMADAGLLLWEVPMNSPDAPGTIAEMSRRFGARAVVGAGTVVDAGVIPALIAAGTRYVVAPNFDAEVVRAARAAGLATAPGIFTPTEAFAALKAGADVLKLFPAEAASPKVVGALKAVLPKATRIVVVGGVEAGNIGPWIAAGAAGFGIGSWLYKPGRSAEEVGRRAREIVAAHREASARG